MRHMNRQPRDQQGNKIWQKLCRFKPPVLLSCLGALFFCTFSLAAIATPWGKAVPAPMLYSIYALAAVFLFTAVWALLAFCRTTAPLHTLSVFVHRHPRIFRLFEDDRVRILSIGYCSLLFNSFMTLSKILAGWWFSSQWLMVLSVYYLILSVTKFLVLRKIHVKSSQPCQHTSIAKEWKTYRLCGCLLVALSFTLQGVAIMIVKEGHGFHYHGYLIFVVALYDFYCLLSSIFYLIRKRKKHSPDIMAIKHISFATSLVSMLSLQTGMFASFGESMPPEQQQLMNFLTSTAVCLILTFWGIAMILTANKKLKQSCIIKK